MEGAAGYTKLETEIMTNTIREPLQEYFCGSLKENYLKGKYSGLVQLSSVTQSCPNLCDPMNCMQHARPPCPSPTPGVHPNPCPWSWWCHPTISSSAPLFSFCLQSFPASGSFQMLSSSYQVAKALEFQLQHQSFQ